MYLLKFSFFFTLSFQDFLPLIVACSTIISSFYLDEVVGKLDLLSPSNELWGWLFSTLFLHV